MNKARIIEAAMFTVVSAAVITAMLLSPIDPPKLSELYDYVYIDTPTYPAAPDISAEENSGERVEVSILYGKDRMDVLASPKETVGALLGKVDIRVSEDTVLNYGADEPVFDGMTLTVGEHVIKHYVETQDIQFDITYINSQTIPKGTTLLKEEGKVGKLSLTHEIVSLGGELIEDTVLTSTVIEEPVNAVYYKGVGGVLTAKDGTQYNFSYYMEVVATAYEAKGITATGKEATDGIIAVDPKVIPYGTKVFVTGNYAEFGVCSAEDCGGFIKGNRIDICMSGPISKLYQFGRRKMIAYILE